MYYDEDEELDEEFDPYDNENGDDGDYDDNGVEKKDSSSSKRSNSVIDNAKNRIKDKTKDKVKNKVSNKLKSKTGKVSNSVKTGKNVAKGAKNTVNTAKTAAKTAKTTARAVKTAMHAMRLIIHAIQAAIHATIALVQAIIAAIAAAWPVVLAVIVILVLILAIFALVNFFSSNFKDMSMTWGYLWSGTSAYVDEDQVSNLYYQLTRNGIDFQEIGAYGEHNFINEKYFSKANYNLIGSLQVDDPAKLDKYGDSFLEDSIRLDDEGNPISLHEYVENLLNQSINTKITYYGVTMPIFSVPQSVSGLISIYDVSDDFRSYTKVRDSYSLLYYTALATKYSELLKPVQADKSAQDFVNNYDINKSTGEEDIYPEEIEKVDQLGPDGKVLMELPRQTGARLYGEALLSFTGNKFEDENSPYNGLNKINPLEGAGLYLNRYLMAEKETYTIRNDMTFAGIGYRGAIYITDGNEYIYNATIVSKVFQSLLNLPLVNNVIGYAIDEAKLKLTALKVVTNWDTGDQSLAAEKDETGAMRFKINWQNDITVPFENGSVFSDENAEKIFNAKNNNSSIYNFKIENKATKLDITNWVKAYAMPWQYPFAFHVATLSPDVGYEIAILAHKYHDLQLTVRNVAKGVNIVVNPSNEKGEKIISDQNIIEPEIFLKYISTWYESTLRSYVHSSLDTWESRSSGWHEAPQGKPYTQDELIALGIKAGDITSDMLNWEWGKATNYDEVHKGIETIEAPTYNTTYEENHTHKDVIYTFNIPDTKELKDFDGYANEEIFVIVKKTEKITNHGYDEQDCGQSLNSSYNEIITYETMELNETMSFLYSKIETRSHPSHSYFDCDHDCDEDCEKNGCNHVHDDNCYSTCDGCTYNVEYEYEYDFEYRYVYDYTYLYEDNYVETINDDPDSKQVIYLTEAEKTNLESQGVEVKTNSTAKDYEKYYRVLELGGRTAMKQILFPDVEITSDGVINESEAVKYYRANSFFEKDYLNISSSAETILKSLYDLYSQTDYTTSPEEVDSLVDEMGLDEVTQIESSDMINGIPNYLCLEGNHIPVIQLIELFVEQGVLSDEQIGRTASTTDFALGAQWVVDDDSFVTSSINGVATIQCGEGKDVFAPYDGTLGIEDIDGVNYVTITSDIFGTTYLSNVNVTKTGFVKKGNVIGVSTGDINYYRIESSVDGISEVADPKDELEDLREKYYATYTWPLPSSGSISSPFGSRKDPVTGEMSKHHGIDIAASTGAKIVSYADGTIESVLTSPVYGNYIVVKHSNNIYTLYAHMSSYGNYGVGSNVKKGDVIGYVGSTGKSTGPHLHFEVRVGGNSLEKAINPTYKLGNYITY
ncbi:MAG: M23 family metallopeptidase [Clostridia bacterium]|nr:M23 family metallopeptidase [Clostridia bacterium]